MRFNLNQLFGRIKPPDENTNTKDFMGTPATSEKAKELIEGFAEIDRSNVKALVEIDSIPSGGFLRTKIDGPFR